MATRSVTVTEHFDDLTGEAIDEVCTVHWVWNGRALAFDVGAGGLQALQSGSDITLAALLKASRPDVADVRASRPEIRKSNRAIREWARDNGWDVGDRGRIATEIIDAYNAQLGD